MAANKQFLGAFDIGDTIDFQVYPAALYGSAFKNMQVTDVVSAPTTILWKFVAAVEHAKVLSDAGVPVGQVPQSFDSYQYVVLKPPTAQGVTDTGQRVVIGLPWIIASSISVSSTRDVIGYFPNVNDAQFTQLRLAISQVLPEFKLDYK
jgi:hypothetical protein